LVVVSVASGEFSDLLPELLLPPHAASNVASMDSTTMMENKDFTVLVIDNPPVT
jgi:hypothetical protein